MFIQDMTGKRRLSLNYGYNTKTKTLDFHWTQKGTFKEFGITDQAPAGTGGEALFKGARYLRYGGRVLLVVGAAIDINSIVGCMVGGFIGYVGASEGAAYIYDWAEGTLFTPVPASDTL
jgi:hypothetical protein